MKRFIRTILCAALLASLAVPALAEEIAGGLVMPLEGWQEKPVESETVVYQGENDTLGLALSVSQSRNLRTNLVYDYSRLTEAELQEMADEAQAAASEDEAIALGQGRIVKTASLTFLAFDGSYKDTAETAEVAGEHFTQYITVAGGGMWQFNFYKEGAALSANEKAQLEENLLAQTTIAADPEPHIDRDIFWKLCAAAAAIMLLVGSLIWHICHRRKKTRKA